jgi:hypothetical protein
MLGLEPTPLIPKNGRHCLSWWTVWDPRIELCTGLSFITELCASFLPGVHSVIPEHLCCTIGRLSLPLKILGAAQPLFKEDGNLDFNMGKTKFLAKGSLSTRHMYERAQHFLQTDPAL